MAISHSCELPLTAHVSVYNSVDMQENNGFGSLKKSWVLLCLMNDYLFLGKIILIRLFSNIKLENDFCIYLVFRPTII